MIANWHDFGGRVDIVFVSLNRVSEFLMPECHHVHCAERVVCRCKTLR